MLALDKIRMEALLKSGTPQEKKYIKRLLPLLEDRHLLIATILLGNALCCEILPEMLDEVIGHIATIVICVTVIVIFCEIVPQALFLKNGLKICYYVSPFTWSLIFLFFAITYPLARLLDCILGKEYTDYYTRDELKELLNMHQLKEKTMQSHEVHLEIQASMDLFSKA
jgi:CBS domain containing-hemolysin-like protein